MDKLVCIHTTQHGFIREYAYYIILNDVKIAKSEEGITIYTEVYQYRADDLDITTTDETIIMIVFGGCCEFYAVNKHIWRHICFDSIESQIDDYSCLLPVALVDRVPDYYKEFLAVAGDYDFKRHILTAHVAVAFCLVNKLTHVELHIFGEIFKTRIYRVIRLNTMKCIIECNYILDENFLFSVFEYPRLENEILITAIYCRDLPVKYAKCVDSCGGNTATGRNVNPDDSESDESEFEDEDEMRESITKVPYAEPTDGEILRAGIWVFKYYVPPSIPMRLSDCQFRF